MTNPDKITKQAIIERFKRIATEYKQNIETIEELQKRQNALSAAAQDCYAAARLFGFDIVAESAAFNDEKPDAGLSSIPPKPPVLPKGKSIKEIVLEIAEKAYPNSLRASDVRLKIEELRGEKLHEKTIGMTLYRLSVDGVMRRDGWNWFFVPLDKRGKEKPAQL